MKNIIKGIDRQIEAFGPEIFKDESKRFFGFAPGKPSLPYLVWTVQSVAPAEYHSGDRIHETFTLQLSIYDTDFFRACDNGEELRKAFENFDMVIPGTDTEIATYKGGESIELDPDYTQEGQEVWAKFMILELMVWRRV